jgi:hypothetical protein
MKQRSAGKSLVAKIDSIEIVTGDGRTQQIKATIVDGPEELLGRKIKVQLSPDDTHRIATMAGYLN